MNENKNPHDVRVGDEYEDLDKSRPQRRIKVVEVWLSEGRAVVLNTRTEHLTKIRLDRLIKRSVGGHGYERVARGLRPDGLEEPNGRTPKELLDPAPGVHLEAFGVRQ